MKTAKHAENLKSLARKIVKEGKGLELSQIDPRRALVRAILAYDTTDARVDEAMVVVDREFVDLNELRVATELEIQAMLGTRYPDIERRAFRIIAILNALFEKEGTFTFERIKTLGKKEVRQYLRDLPEMTPFIEAYAVLHSMDTPAVPVDDVLLDYALEHDAADEAATPDDLQKALETLLKPEEIPEFHLAARRLLVDRTARKRK